MALGIFPAVASSLAGGLLNQPPKKERKTIIGKFFQNVTSDTSQPIGGQSSPVPPLVNSNRQGVSGTLQFGQNQRLNILPFAIVAGFVAVVYFIFGGKKKRRR